MIYLFYGEDSWTLAQELKNLKSQFALKYGMSGIEEMSLGKETDSELTGRLRDALSSQGLFSTKKLLLLRNFLGALNKFPEAESYLAASMPKLSEDITLVFLQTEDFDKRLKFYKGLQKLAKLKEFVMPQGTELKTWIINYLQAEGFVMEPDALAKFIELLGENTEETLYDLWQVSRELDKLMLLKSTPSLSPSPPASPAGRQGGGKTEDAFPLPSSPLVGEARWGGGIITKADVQEIVQPNIAKNLFTLTNMFAEGRSRDAVNFLEQMVESGPAAEIKTQSLQLIGGLASQIRSLLLVKDLEREAPGIIAETLKWKEGRVWINLKLAKKFSKEKLFTLLKDLKALDLRLKTSEEPPKLLLALFFQKAKA